MDNQTEKDVIGYVASILYVISLFPEIYVVYKTRECQLTIYFLFFQIVTTSLFLRYDTFLHETPLFIADGLLMLELIFLFIFKLLTLFRKKKEYEPVKYHDSRIKVTVI